MARKIISFMISLKWAVRGARKRCEEPLDNIATHSPKPSYTCFATNPPFPEVVLAADA